MNCLLVSYVVSLFFLFVAVVCLFICYILLLVFLVWWMSVMVDVCVVDVIQSLWECGSGLSEKKVWYGYMDWGVCRC